MMASDEAITYLITTQGYEKWYEWTGELFFESNEELFLVQVRTKDFEEHDRDPLNLFYAGRILDCEPLNPSEPEEGYSQLGEV